MSGKYLRRVARNLALALLPLAALWYVKGYPLPTQEMEFRRLERQRLAGRSEIIFRCESQGEAMLGDPNMLLGVTDTAVHTSSDSHTLRVWPRDADGPTLVTLPSELKLRPVFTVGLAAVDPPEGTFSARLTITLGVNDWEEDYTVEGERQGAVWLFTLPARHTEDDLRSLERHALSDLTHQDANTFLFPYTVEFLDAEGALLDTLTYLGWDREVVAS